MRKLVLLYASFFTMVLLISASPVCAQTVLWVSATGSGTTCSTASPCGTFEAAITAGATEIHCLNSGNYGPVLITASIIIDCGAGNVGNISVSTGGSAIALPNTSNATVALRHLSLNGNGDVNFGIDGRLFSSGSLIVEDCIVQGFVGAGIEFDPQGGRGLLLVSNSQIVGNDNGIVVTPNNQIASVTLNRVELVGNSFDGLLLAGSGVVAGTMRDSVAGSNATGVLAGSDQVFFSIEGSSIVANPSFGIRTLTAGSTVEVGTSAIGGNGTGVKADSGSLISFGNNQFSANGVDGSFTSTKAGK